MGILYGWHLLYKSINIIPVSKKTILIAYILCKVFVLTWHISYYLSILLAFLLFFMVIAEYGPQRNLGAILANPFNRQIKQQANSFCGLKRISFG